jgi:DNA-directed RNA polymerase subunit H (RpoH/RPB5)|uniref:RNA polymerase subunit H/Rpb5 C-terminal domain-containing protein n=1 Tax=viral metagenome TaxID=1070528 RepID=A0A6C0F0D0_9ZZZZ
MEELSIAALQELKKTRPLSAEEIALSTIQEMLTSRGLVADKFELVPSNMDGTKMYSFAGILLIFSTKTRVSEKELNNFLSFASENNFASGIIIVSPSRPSESVMKVLIGHNADRDNVYVQIFDIRSLGFNISKHRKVPQHRICKENEKPEIIKNYNLKSLEQMPKILSQDAMAKFIGARPGDVVEVVGLCETSADNLRYRYCVAEGING